MAKHLFRRKFRLFTKLFALKQQKTPSVEQQQAPATVVPTKPAIRQSSAVAESAKSESIPKPAVQENAQFKQRQQKQGGSQQFEANYGKLQQQKRDSFIAQKVGSGSLASFRTEPAGFAQSQPFGMSPLVGFETMAQSQWGGSTTMLVSGRKELQQVIDIEEIWSQPTVVLKPWEIQCGA